MIKKEVKKQTILKQFEELNKQEIEYLFNFIDGCVTNWDNEITSCKIKKRFTEGISDLQKQVGKEFNRTISSTSSPGFYDDRLDAHINYLTTEIQTMLAIKNKLLPLKDIL